MRFENSRGAPPLGFTGSRAGHGDAPRLQDPLAIELAALSPDLRWREWVGRVEAVIFASPMPVTHEILARLVGHGCNIVQIIDDIRKDLFGRHFYLLPLPAAGSIAHARAPPTRSALPPGAMANPGRCRDPIISY
ncbi:Segregation and condensation protein B [Hyphomicrobiales bacterium]|nr:Segregation and condensation protein B [Hyphomicrobiales bacterium]CAH1692486.1 Segregation and condensation protein B [Hyphomicrobiales bacterium]